MNKTFLALTLFLPSILFAGESGINQIIPTSNWTGFYVGGSLGQAFNTLRGSVSDAPYIDQGGVFFPSFAQPYNANHRVFAGGAQLGYLHQINQFVYGTELSVIGLNHKNSHTLKDEDVGQFINIFKPGDTFYSDINWQASWVARGGTQLKNWLFYGLGGVTTMNHKISTKITSILIDGDIFPASEGSDEKILVGGAIGLGAEYALWANSSIGLEYRYAHFGKHQYSVGQNAVSALPNGFIYTDLKASATLVNNLVLVRFNYFFN